MRDGNDLAYLVFFRNHFNHLGYGLWNFDFLFRFALSSLQHLMQLGEDKGVDAWAGGHCFRFWRDSDWLVVVVIEIDEVVVV